MKRMITKTIIIGLLGFSSQINAQETVAVLDKGEPYDSMVADNGILWVSKSRENFNSNYKLEAYNVDGSLLDSVALSHSLNVMKPTNSGSVVVTGINPDSRLTEYTYAKLVQGRIRTTTTTIALGGFISFWIGDIGSKRYFIDQGGNPNDTDIFSPAQTIFQSTSTRARYLSTRLRMPVSGLVVDNKLFLVSSEGIGSSSSKIVEVDPNTQQIRTLLQSKTAGFSNLELTTFENKSYFVSNARKENKLVVIAKDSGEVFKEFPTEGYTRSVAVLGSCVVAGNDETNTIEAFSLRSATNTPFLTAKVELPPNLFSGIKRIAIDRSTGTLFVRSALACNPMIDPCTDDNNRVLTMGPELGRKLLANCQ